MKYDIAMQLLNAGIIKQEEFELVSKVLEGVKLSKDDLERGDLTKISDYYKEFLGFTDNGTFEIKRVVDEKFTLIYTKFTLFLSITVNKLGQMKLHINEFIADGFDLAGTYILDKDFDEDQIKVAFYDKEATKIIIESVDKNVLDDLINNRLDTKDCLQCGLSPAREGVIEEENIIDLASNLIRPAKTNISSFDEELDKVTNFNNGQYSNK